MTGSYEFPGLPIDPVPPGRTLLVSAPALETATEAVLGAAVPSRTDEGAVLVSTTDTGDVTLDRWRDLGLAEGAPALVVDCVSRQQGRTPTDDRVACAAAPSDLTGLGMRTTECYERLVGADVTRIRLGLCSLSTLLRYADLRPVFRLAHTLTGRVTATDGIGLLALDRENNDERVHSTFEQLCDGVLDVREAPGGTEFRLRGVPDHAPDWRPTA